jgi:hypothetical protein
MKEKESPTVLFTQLAAVEVWYTFALKEDNILSTLFLRTLDLCDS